MSSKRVIVKEYLKKGEVCNLINSFPLTIVVLSELENR